MSALNHSGNDYAARLAAASRTPQELRVAPKIYYHHHNYAKFHFDFGGSHVKSVSFANNRYITDDKREQDQLDLVADVPGTFIYTIADSDVARAMAQELQQEGAKDIVRTAQAASAVSGQMFDPNAPIIPIPPQGVQVTHMQQSPGVAVVGLGNSFSGTQATEQLNMTATTRAGQTAAPSAADAAAARLAEMTAIANKQS